MIEIGQPFEWAGDPAVEHVTEVLSQGNFKSKDAAHTVVLAKLSL